MPIRSAVEILEYAKLARDDRFILAWNRVGIPTLLNRVHFEPTTQNAVFDDHHRAIYFNNAFAAMANMPTKEID